MGAFVEHYNGGNYRKHMFRDMSSSNLFDIPLQLHLLKTESLDFLDIDELEEVQND